MIGPIDNGLGFVVDRDREGRLFATDSKGKIYSKQEYIQFLQLHLTELETLHCKYCKSSRYPTFRDYAGQFYPGHLTNITAIILEIDNLIYADDDEQFYHDLNSGRI